MKPQSKKLIFSIIFLSIFILLISIFSLPQFKLSHINIESELAFINKNYCIQDLETLKNKSIATIFIKNLIEKKLSEYPEILTYTTNFTFPNKLSIHIKERTPWISTITNGKSVFIDHDGYILKRQPDAKIKLDENIFIIKGLSIQTNKQNKLPTEQINQLKSYESLLKKYLPNHQLLLEQIHNHFWQIIVNDQLIIRLGQLNDLTKKFNRIKYFLETQNPTKYNKIDYIDCRINNKLLVKYENK